MSIAIEITVGRDGCNRYITNECLLYAINTPEFLAYEGFRTHTSYLNIQWNNNLIDSWKKSHFEGKDFEYDGSKIDSLTGFKYVNDHLGYRFVLRESWITDTGSKRASWTATRRSSRV